MNTIKLDLVSIDAGTRQRPLDDNTVSRYLSLMDDGVEFPPVEVVSDGPNFWLWDGFHRTECTRRRQQKSIAAHVTKGTLRDAIWLSFGANKEHGLPRQKGIAKKIITSILTDTSWSKKSLTAIARHVGVTREYVSKTKSELEAHGVNSLHHRKGENGDSKPKTQVQEKESVAVQRSDEIVVKRGGTKYKQKSQEKQHKADQADEPPKDAAGRIIPEHLREIYENRTVIKQYLNSLSKLKDDFCQHIDNHDPALSLLNVTAFKTHYTNLRRTLKSAMPYAVCVYCGGDSKNCKACDGIGFLNKDTYNSAPKEFKL